MPNSRLDTIEAIRQKYKDNPAVDKDLQALVIAAAFMGADAAKQAAVEFCKETQTTGSTQREKNLQAIITIQQGIIASLKALHQHGASR